MAAGNRDSKIQGEKGPKGRLENGTSVPRERVWSEPPSRHGEMTAQERVRDTKAQGGSFTPVLETPAVASRAGMRPRVTSGGGKGTKAKTEEGGPLEILTPFRQSASEPT